MEFYLAPIHRTEDSRSPGPATTEVIQQAIIDETTGEETGETEEVTVVVNPVPNGISCLRYSADQVLVKCSASIAHPEWTPIDAATAEAFKENN